MKDKEIKNLENSFEDSEDDQIVETYKPEFEKFKNKIEKQNKKLKRTKFKKNYEK